MKAILFDLDGVITDTKEIHYSALNEAILLIAGEKYIITHSEHINLFDGLKTATKLNMLSKMKGLDPSLFTAINNKKQELTIKKFSEIEKDERMISIFRKLRDLNYVIGCCTNCISRTAYTALANVGVLPYIDLILTNDDVKNAKPHPEIYWKAMSMLSISPNDTLIVEDSPQGLQAAFESGAHIIRVKNSTDVTYEKIINKIKNKKIMNKKWIDEKMNVLIPMAGAGSRFEKAGFTFPKPLIDINGKPMIQVVVEGLNIEANYIYIVQKSHREKYNLDTLLNLITPNCKIVEVDGLTEGAACTTLLAKEYINNDNQLIITNSDQFIDWDSIKFMYKVNEKNVDGAIITFESTHPKWSFAKVDNNDIITEVAEKNPISTNATAGIYYFKHGKDYVESAEQMISKNIRTNNEFYVCPAYNEAILNDKKVLNYSINSTDMWGLGTPEDLKNYLENYKG